MKIQCDEQDNLGTLVCTPSEPQRGQSFACKMTFDSQEEGRKHGISSSVFSLHDPPPPLYCTIDLCTNAAVAVTDITITGWVNIIIIIICYSCY